VIDFEFSNSNKPETGTVLISEPFLSDDYFSRSVIYLCEHNQDGSFGFVLNKYLEKDLNELIPNIGANRIKVSIGGPVDNSNLFYLHTLGDRIPDSIQIHKNVSVGGKFEQLKDLLKEDPEAAEHVRFFIGYAGWSPGQLDEEIAENSWIVLKNVPIDYLFDTRNTKLWTSIMEKLGGKFKLMSKFPINPSDN
jgi:putative transcriptional regulator